MGCYRDFSWSPTDNIIAYWVPEVDQIPAKVTLIEIPSRKEIRTKNLFLVQDVCVYIITVMCLLAYVATYIKFSILTITL